MFKFIISIVAILILFISVGPIEMGDKYEEEWLDQKQIVWDSERIVNYEKSVYSQKKGVEESKNDINKYIERIKYLEYELNQPINKKMALVYNELMSTSKHRDARHYAVRNFIDNNEEAYYNYMRILEEYNESHKILEHLENSLSISEELLSEYEERLVDFREEVLSQEDGEKLIQLFNKGYTATYIIDNNMYEPLQKKDTKYSILAFTTWMSFLFLAMFTPFGYVVGFIISVILVGKVMSKD